MPSHESRLRAGDAGAAVLRRLGDVVVADSWLTVDKTLDDVDVLLTAMSGLTEHPVMSWRPSTGVGLTTLGCTAATVDAPVFHRLVHRWVRHALGLTEPRPRRVGMLGFGAIGVEHVDALASVAGLELAAVCDRVPARLQAARELVPAVATYDDPDDLLDQGDVDAVIVSTPPNTHATWALRALESGRHVVVEKPFCLTTAEADELIATARARGLSLLVYQNRRWDLDFLSVKSVLRSGRIGDLFHYESFVGGYGHPCNMWHSDEEVSGGAIYDWGSHYLDWMLDLVPQPVESVTAVAHKLRWHDVTNSDHVRVGVRLADGTEAEFMHSDLAAAMKPKWYLLGTDGAIVGSWRRERVLARDRVGNLLEDRLAAAESPADVTVHHVDGSVTTLALPSVAPFPFHRELADLLLIGEPTSVTAEQSRRNVSVMEAATSSLRDGGRPVAPL
jgi:predicted dehydrogenase